MAAERNGKRNSPILNALRGRCPRCGSGRLYSGYLKIADSCDACGLSFAGHDSADGPAVMIMLVLGFIVAGLVLAVELAFQPPFWVHALIWPPVVIFGALGLLRPFKSIFVGIQYKYRAVDREFPADDV
jgi:uncharacterized protein (DUF983 family)